MDTLTRSSRISFACAFGATTFLVYQIVLEGALAIDVQGSRAARSFLAIVSVFIYGMVFCPVFTCLAMGSVFGYGLGALYVWMLTGVQIYKLTECQSSAKGRAFLVLRSLPSLLCLVYLSVSIPARLLQSYRKGWILQWKYEADRFTDSLDVIRNHSTGQYVSKLFRKPKVKKSVEGSKLITVKAFLIRLVYRFLYHSKKGFRYPSRILSVMLVGTMVIYTIAFEVLVIAPALLDFCRHQPAVIRADPNATDTSGDFVCNISNVLRTCVITGVVLATLVSLLNVLHMLSSYRRNILALYRGDHSHIPPASVDSNVSHCINSIKFGGFQVGYMVWGFVIQSVILTLICVILAIFVLLIAADVTAWVIAILEYIWPIVVIFIVILVVQKLLAKFVFLQDSGAYLALDNRSIFFNFTYFMFFYNIFLGVASCLLRILKAIAIGIFFLSRLDNSTLSRRFEFFDPGFTAYVGYMQMEYAHSHPVVIVFTRLVLHMWKEARKRQNEDSIPAFTVNDSDCEQKVVDAETPPDNQQEDSFSRRRMKARSNWHVSYTLLHNPDLRVLRKGFVQLLRQARELGVRVPISDNQANIDTHTLAEQIQRAKEDSRVKLRKGGEDEPDVTASQSDRTLVNRKNEYSKV
ncbi:receptor for retinol uptake stra6-like isoform X2 [Pomacea canaliculata]|nr:receptor for retinol uptake stra6-like isoform X2 [Pomacea canaliculata]